MLPFLKSKRSTGISVEYRKPDQQKEENQEDPALKACADDILKAVEERNPKALASALRAAFDVLQSQPGYEDSQHIEE